MTNPSGPAPVPMAPPGTLADARSFLFVPGNRPERFEKAVRSGADAIVLDLEDAVPPAEKAAARDAVARRWDQLRALGTALVVRINPLEHALGQEDLAFLSQLTDVTAVMVPKAESAAALQAARKRLPEASLLPLIESAAGWSALAALAACPGVLRLVVGNIDFMADTCLTCDEDETELLPLRFAVAMATRLRCLAPPVDGVTVAIYDDERLRKDTQRSLRLGFGAKLCVHPRQVALVHQVLQPSVEQYDWAQRVVQAEIDSGGAAVQIDGQMIDRPVVTQAHRLLARYRISSQ